MRLMCLFRCFATLPLYSLVHPADAKQMHTGCQEVHPRCRHQQQGSGGEQGFSSVRWCQRRLRRRTLRAVCGRCSQELDQLASLSVAASDSTAPVRPSARGQSARFAPLSPPATGSLMLRHCRPPPHTYQHTTKRRVRRQEVERAWGMGWAAVGSVGCLTPRALKEGTQLQSHRGGRLAWARRGLSTGAKAVTRSAAAKLRLLGTLPQGPARSSHLAGGQPLRRF